MKQVLSSEGNNRKKYIGEKKGEARVKRSRKKQQLKEEEKLKSRSGTGVECRKGRMEKNMRGRKCGRKIKQFKREKTFKESKWNRC